MTELPRTSGVRVIGDFLVYDNYGLRVRLHPFRYLDHDGRLVDAEYKDAPVFASIDEVTDAIALHLLTVENHNQGDRR